MSSKKVVIPIMFFVGAVVFLIGYSHAVTFGIDHSSRVVVTEWNLLDRNDLAISESHPAEFQIDYALEFSWTINAPAGTTFQAGDHFRLERPMNSSFGGWYQQSALPWTNFHGSDPGVILGRYRVLSSRIEVEFNSSVNGMNQINATFRTPGIFRNEQPRQMVQQVTFGEITRTIAFNRQRLGLIHVADFHTARASSNTQIRFGTVLGERAKYDFAQTNNFIGRRNAYLEAPLTGELLTLLIVVPVHHPYHLETQTPSASAAIQMDVTDLFARVDSNPGESLTAFRNRLNPRQWGIHTDNLGNETLVISFGTFGQNGIRYLDLEPNLVDRAIGVAIENHLYDESDIPALRAFFQRMMNASNGEALTYHVHITQGFAPVDTNTVVHSTVRIFGDGNEQTIDASGMLIASTGAGDVLESIARIHLHDEETLEPLPGVMFRLQMEDANGVFIPYTSWAGGRTNEYGYVDTTLLGEGTYRFVQMDKYSDEYDLTISRGFDYLLETVVSEPFTITIGETEGKERFVTNARRRICVTYLPGDCGIFEEQVTCDLVPGGEIPEFNGNPDGEDVCEFDGWDRIETEDGDIIYTARWNRRNSNGVIRVPDTLANLPLWVKITGSILIISGVIIIIKTKLNKKKK